MSGEKHKIDAIDFTLKELSGYGEECHLCPRDCGANRKRGERGFCESGIQACLSHALLHFGEEPVLSGYHDCGKENKSDESSAQSGSGTLFFSGCNLKCLFCQNYQLSWLNQGQIVSDEEMAEKMLLLQKQGALNINLVSPTHVILPILRALKIAFRKGLHVPIVWNSNGYEKAEVVRYLRGIIDVFLPDLKYFSPKISKKYSGASDYFLHASQAIKEMHRQQPSLLLDDQEVAIKGLIIRHLVLPGMIEDSKKILERIARNLSPSVTVSLMSQYNPCFKAPPELQKPLSSEEYRNVLARAEELGFENLFIQPEGFSEEEHLIPDFNLSDPFKWN